MIQHMAPDCQHELEDMCLQHRWPGILQAYHCERLLTHTGCCCRALSKQAAAAGMGMQEAAEVLQYCFSDALAAPSSGEALAAEAAGGAVDAAAAADSTEEPGRDGWTQLQCAGAQLVRLPPLDTSDGCALLAACCHLSDS